MVIGTAILVVYPAIDPNIMAPVIDPLKTSVDRGFLFIKKEKASVETVLELSAKNI